MPNPQFQIYRNAGNTLTCGAESVGVACRLIAQGKSSRETFVLAPHPAKLPNITPFDIHILQFKVEQNHYGEWCVCQTDEQGKWANLLYVMNPDDTADAISLAMAMRERIFIAQAQVQKQSKRGGEIWDMWIWRQPTGREYDTPANLIRELAKGDRHAS